MLNTFLRDRLFVAIGCSMIELFVAQDPFSCYLGKVVLYTRLLYYAIICLT